MLKFPTDCITVSDKVAYCYRAQEVLRLKHNAMGKQFRDGDITADDWQVFLSKIFDPMSTKITADLLINREIPLSPSQKDLLKNSTRFNLVTLDDIQEEK